jgi:hypothetical protein
MDARDFTSSVLRVTFTRNAAAELLVYSRMLRCENLAARSRKVCTWIFFLLLLMQFSAPAWNNVGHRAVAELVWRRLDNNQQRAVSKLLRQHPHYKQLLVDNSPPGVSKDEWAFLTAAVWPDMVRPAKEGQSKKAEAITKYDLYPHAIGFPIVWPEDKDKVSIDDFSVGNPDAEQVLSNCLVTLKSPSALADNRAVNLCWVLHLIADLHQPLHAATIVTPKKPRGDGLGGWYLVIAPNGKRINLHAYWDELPGIEPSYRSVERVADEIAGAESLKAERLPEYRQHKTIRSWVKESYDYAANFAYSRNRVRYAHIEDLDSGKVTAMDIPKLEPAYASEARTIAMRRLALAALRAYDELKEVW